MVRLGLAALLFAGLSTAVQDTEQGTAVTHVPGAYIFEFEENHVRIYTHAFVNPLIVVGYCQVLQNC
jgi:hypothetical protein